MNKYGAVGPIGSRQTNATVGGHTWKCTGAQRSNRSTPSCARATPTPAPSTSAPSLHWIRDRGWFGDVTVGNVQFGFEITSSSGGKNFTTNQLLGIGELSPSATRR